LAVTGVDVSNRAGLQTYLKSLGIDPKGVVIQRSKHNYAGPSCPGAGWTCTTAKRVVQLSYGANNNQFECTPSPGGSATPPNTCTIIQISSTGANNVARCTERTTDASASQSCLIYQSNTTGSNRADVIQQVNAASGATQSATQYAGVRQDNVSGSNAVFVNQDLRQSTKDTNAGTQTQNGHQTVSTLQESDTGDNNADVHQSLALQEMAFGLPVVTQNQDTDGTLNTQTAIRQFSTSGRNSANLDQANDLNANVAKAGTATQTQGSPTGGLLGHFEQDSTGLSTVHGSQRETQNVVAAQVGTLSQTQYGPMSFGSDQGTNPNDRYDIDQSSTQQASSPSAYQSDQAYANCDTTGICTATQRINQDGQTERNSCSAPSCHIGLVVTTSSEGTNTFTCEGLESPIDLLTESSYETTTCPSPPAPPPPPPALCGTECIGIGALTYGVRH